MRTLHTTYTAVSEATAKAAKEMNSYSRYKEGTATEEQNYYVNKIVEYAISCTSPTTPQPTALLMRAN